MPICPVAGSRATIENVDTLLCATTGCFAIQKTLNRKIATKIAEAFCIRTSSQRVRRYNTLTKTS